MTIINRSKTLLTVSATLMLLLTGCAHSSDDAATTTTTTSHATQPEKTTATKASTAATNTPSNQTPLLYETEKTEVSNIDIGYVKVDKFTDSSTAVNPIRWQALYETAMSLGATGALAWRGEQINASLEKNAKQLDQVFNFNQLLIDKNVLPPVLVEGDNSLNVANDDSIRLASKTYQIINQARFVSTAPTWHSYLAMNFSKPPVPDRTLLPKNKAEATLWNQFIKKGWESGIQQANAIFSSNLNRLRRDYNGMVLYRKLLAQGMVSAPFVAKADLGVTGDSNQIRIDDRVLRITGHSELQTDSSKWTPIITDPNQTLNP